MTTRYYLDTEFNSFGGSLISLGIVQHDNPENNLYLVVPQCDIDRMIFEESMDPWIKENILPNIARVPDIANHYVMPVHEWPDMIGKLIYGTDCSETPHIFVDWPSDAMDFSRLLMTGPGHAVDMSHQTLITILRHIDVYPTSLEGAVQHNAIWDAMAIRQLLIELESKNTKPLPKSSIERLGRPMNHKPETQAAIQRLGDEFHKTRLSHHVCVEPGDLKLALEALGYYD
jgi:hypothetical protein